MIILDAADLIFQIGIQASSLFISSPFLYNHHSSLDREFTKTFSSRESLIVTKEQLIVTKEQLKYIYFAIPTLAHHLSPAIFANCEFGVLTEGILSIVLGFYLFVVSITYRSITPRILILNMALIKVLIAILCNRRQLSRCKTESESMGPYKSIINRIICSEVPSYIFATFYSFLDKNKIMQPYFYLCSGLFLGNSISYYILVAFRRIYNTPSHTDKAQSIEDEELNISEARPSNIINISILKLLSEVNDNFVLLLLATKMNKSSHLLYFFTFKFLLNLGYFSIPMSWAFLLFPSKLFIFAASFLFAIPVLNRTFLVVCHGVLIINGVTNQAVYATFDHNVHNIRLRRFLEGICFVIVSLFIVFYVLGKQVDLGDLAFMCNIRL